MPVTQPSTMLQQGSSREKQELSRQHKQSSRQQENPAPQAQTSNMFTLIYVHSYIRTNGLYICYNHVPHMQNYNYTSPLILYI